MEVLNFANWSLILAALTMTAIASIGIYQALFVHPKWFESPPESLKLFREDTSVKLWIPLQVVTLATLIASLSTHAPGVQRNLIVASLTCYVVTWILTFIFFIPGVIAFRKVDVNGPPSKELQLKGRRWLRRSTARLVLMLAASIMLLMALAL